MKHLTCILPIYFLAGIFFSCNTGTYSTDDSGTASSTGSTSTIDTSEFSESLGDTADTYDEDDDLDYRSFDDTIYIDLDNLAAGTSTSYGYDFSSSTVTFDDYDVSISVADADSDDTADEICINSSSSGMTFVLTGSTDCTLYIESSSDFQLYLDGVDIEASEGSALIIASEVRCFITSASDSSNILADASSEGELTKKGALYSKGILVFGGGGELTVNGSYKHGVFSKDYIRVTEGTLNVNVTVRDAIRSVNGFIFDDGELTVTATGTTEDDESKGIKVEGDESADGAGLGYIVINGGTIDITSVSKGMTASWDEEDDAEDDDDSNDPDADVIINNGVITVTTTGEVYETDDASCSPEGIEGKDDLVINSGYIVINTADDCLNGGTSITIAGGYIYCVSTDNDAIDSNGTLTITGGVIIAVGADGSEDGFDCDDNTFTVTGGTLIGMGGGTSEPSSSTTQPVLLINNSYGFGSGSCLSVVDSSSDCVFAFELPDSADTILLSASGITEDSSYGLYSGGEASSDDLFYGLCLGDISYTTGTLEDSFTVNSYVYSLGGAVTGFH